MRGPAQAGHSVQDETGSSWTLHVWRTLRGGRPERLELARQTRKGERAHREAQIAQRDVEVRRDAQQVDDDPAEPQPDDRGANLRRDRDEQAGPDLDDADA